MVPLTCGPLVLAGKLGEPHFSSCSGLDQVPDTVVPGQTSKRAKVEAAGLALEIIHCYFCGILLVKAGHRLAQSHRSKETVQLLMGW